jgi:hypothetical protein
MGTGKAGMQIDKPKMPRKGDIVAWQTPQGQTHGTVEQILTSTTKVKGHTAKASKDAPQVLVKSQKSGKEAAHKPGSLKKV